MKTFAEVERDFVREKSCRTSKFEWFDQPSQVDPLRIPAWERPC